MLPIVLREYGYAILTLAFLYALNIPMLITINSLMATVDALAMPARPALIADLTPKHRRGVFMALHLSVRQAFNSLGVALGFILWQTMGLATPFYLRTAIFATTGTLLLTLVRSTR